MTQWQINRSELDVQIQKVLDTARDKGFTATRFDMAILNSEGKAIWFAPVSHTENGWAWIRDYSALDGLEGPFKIELVSADAKTWLASFDWLNQHVAEGLKSNHVPAPEPDRAISA